MSAVYPFARSHNDYWSIPQEPYSLGDDVLRTAFMSLRLRYVFLSQYYSLWILSQGMTPFFCSLAYYPDTLNEIKDISQYDWIVSSQFLILDIPWLIAPMLEQGKTTR